jgi:hypothetical protein
VVNFCHWIESDGVDASLPTVTDEDFEDLMGDYGRDHRIKILIDAFKELRKEHKVTDVES